LITVHKHSKGLKNFFDIADYITVNISSPNTEGLRDFHDQEKLIDLMVALNKIKKDNGTNIPLLLKISPDINNSHIPEIADAAIKNNISAIIIANMRIGGITEPVVYKYIEETRFWANSMKADIDSISVEILAAKLDKHLSKPFDISDKYGRGPDYERKRVLKPKYPQVADKGDKEMTWYMRLLQGWKFGITGGINWWSAIDIASSSGSGYNIVIKTPFHFATEKLETHIRLETGGIKFSTNLNGNQTAAYVQFGLRDSNIPLINRMMLDIGMGSTLGNPSFSSGLLITLRKKKLDLIARYVSASSTAETKLPPNWISISLGFNF